MGKVRKKKMATPPSGAVLTEGTRPERRGMMILMLVLITIAFLVPFSGKAFNIDDPLFIWAAQQIQAHPLDPYGFDLIWYFDPLEMWKTMKNPPLASYYIAFVAFLFGWGERALHCAFMVWPATLMVATYLLAERCRARPFFTALLTLSMPVFLISSTTVMCDVMMLSFYVWAIVAWIRGHDTGRLGYFLLAAALASAAALTKYFGASLLVLLPAYSIARTRRIGWWVCALLVIAGTLVWYQLATHGLYGRGLLLDAGDYARKFRTVVSMDTLSKVLIAFSFTGGCLLTAAFGLSALLRRWHLALKGALFGALFVLILGLGTVGRSQLAGSAGTEWSLVLQMALFTTAGVAIMAFTVVHAWRDRGNPEVLLLAAWMGGTFFFTGFLNWTVNGRSLLPMAPAAAILVGRYLAQAGAVRARTLAAILVPGFIIALLATGADYALAGSARKAAEDLRQRYGARKDRVYFQGHWGFQYYMHKYGFRIIGRRSGPFFPGIIAVVPGNNCFTFRLPESLTVTSRDTIAVPLHSLCATMSRPRAAGFYSDMWGAMPFSFGVPPPERYTIIETT